MRRPRPVKIHAGGDSDGDPSEAPVATVVQAEAQGAEIVPTPPPAPLAKRDETDILADAEERIYGESLEVMEGVQMFWRIFGDDVLLAADKPPDEWYDLFEGDVERGDKMFRLAKTGLLTKQDAPMGIHVAIAHAQSVAKVRAARQDAKGSTTLNIEQAVVQFPGAPSLYPGESKYPSREVDDE